MISVENFYWALYENLLGPSGIDCWYYFPFGTTQNLSGVGQFQDWRGKQPHVLFHFDQEPLWQNNLGDAYEINSMTAHSIKIPRMLANSEHSEIKKTVCRQRSMLDWYFFYHGFAAHDWFRDTRYLGDCIKPSKVFVSLNHLTQHKRNYRLALSARLMAKGLEHHGSISLHTTRDQCEHEINRPDPNLSNTSRCLISQHMIEKSVPLPLILDRHEIDSSFSARFGREEYNLWQKSFLHVVNETVFYDKKLHLTEKIFKPIVSMRPFILVAAPGNLQYLKSYGFRTFDRWIDETYDSIEDNDSRLDAITNQIEILCKMHPHTLHDMLNDMHDTLIYNKQHFFTNFKKIIIDELVDNFDTCVRIWNNGRIDPDRRILCNIDMSKIKNVLAGTVIVGT